MKGQSCRSESRLTLALVVVVVRLEDRKRRQKYNGEIQSAYEWGQSYRQIQGFSSCCIHLNKERMGYKEAIVLLSLS